MLPSMESMRHERQRLHAPWARLSLGIGVFVALGSAACDPTDGGAREGPADPTTTPSTCAAPSGVSASPSNIEEIVELVNGLVAAQAKPVTLPCVVESLKRPIGVLAAISTFSLQPSAGPGSPRIFLFSGDLVATVVPGKGQDLLELAERTTETRSLKAELEFPLEVALSGSEPYARIRRADGTVCAACHGGEVPAAERAGALSFESDILRPLATQEVPLAQIQSEALACDVAAEPERCALLTAVFGHGETYPQYFSAQANTFGL